MDRHDAITQPWVLQHKRTADMWNDVEVKPFSDSRYSNTSRMFFHPDLRLKAIQCFWVRGLDHSGYRADKW